jgi:hypothetical protein
LREAQLEALPQPVFVIRHSCFVIYHSPVGRSLIT